MLLKKAKRGGFYFFSSHMQRIKYEPLHPLVVNVLHKTSKGMREMNYQDT